VAGYRDGRSPDVFGITTAALAVRGPHTPAWPSSADTTSPTATVALWGKGVDERAALPAKMRLDDVAPTLAEVIGLRRPHPEVRSGSPVSSVAGRGTPRLALVAVVQGSGERVVSRWASAAGATSSRVDTGSLPADPVATLTTLGTGGLPHQHGITGALVRDDNGRLRTAWGPGSPVSVIATLADDLDEANGDRARIGLVAPYRGARGLIGGNWYLRGDRDDLIVTNKVTGAATKLLESGYGSDEIADFLAVVIDGRGPRPQVALRRVIDAAAASSGGSLAVVAVGLRAPAATADDGTIPVAEVVRRVERGTAAGIIEAAAAGGLFLDQRALAERKISEETVAAALRDINMGAGRRLFDDAFSGVAVSFARYC
jgi:hypothetical protein